MSEMYQDPRDQFRPKNPAMVQFLIDLGLAKDAKSANVLLIIFMIIFFGVSIYLFFSVL